MRLLALSDLHGDFPDTRRWPSVDVAIIAGDVSRSGGTTGWLTDYLVPWLQTIDAAHIILIWGNHDFIGEQVADDWHGWPSHVHVLTNRGVTLDGVTFYGVPQTPKFGGWAFMEPDAHLGQRWAAVPADTDVLVSHGPPRGLVDNNLGSVTQREWLETSGPALVLCGHIHECGGISTYLGDTRVANVAVKDLAYRTVRGPLVLDFDPTTGVTLVEEQL